MSKATAVANPNIAFIKYWGKADEALNLAANPSLSMNLAALTTVTTVEFRTDRPQRAGQACQDADTVTIDGQLASGQARARVVAHLDRVRALAGLNVQAAVASRSDFPAGTGLASSSSAFAALSLAATRAAGIDLNETELSRLARLGSGSACRSVVAGFARWEGDSDATSYARQVARPEHWDLRDVIVIVSTRHKAVCSHDGHRLAGTSPLHRARLDAVPQWMLAVETGIRHRDLAVMGPAIEADALAMHAVMMTSRPSLWYWTPATVAVVQAVRAWRGEGLEAWITLDAGPNVHCICRAADACTLEERLRLVPGVEEILVSGPGGAARLLEFHLF